MWASVGGEKNILKGKSNKYSDACCAWLCTCFVQQYCI